MNHAKEHNLSLVPKRCNISVNSQYLHQLYRIIFRIFPQITNSVTVKGYVHIKLSTFEFILAILILIVYDSSVILQFPCRDLLLQNIPDLIWI